MEPWFSDKENSSSRLQVKKKGTEALVFPYLIKRRNRRGLDTQWGQSGITHRS